MTQNVNYASQIMDEVHYRLQRSEVLCEIMHIEENAQNCRPQISILNFLVEM